MTISKGPQAFPRSEYLRRLAAVKSEMGNREIDALFVSSPGNVAYLSGFTTKGYSPASYLIQGLVVTLHEEEPTFILARHHVPAAVYLTFLKPESVIGYPSLTANPGVDGFDAVIDFLHEAGLANRGVGLELDSLRAQDQQKFKARLPKARIVDCAKAVDWIRTVKSDLEIAIMREAAAITDAGIMHAAEVIRPGVREADAAAEIMATLLRGTNGKSGTGIPLMYVSASPRTFAGHMSFSEDAYRDGSQINIELGAVRYGYIATIMRTFSIGKPSDRLRRLHEAQVAGLEAALNTVRPGATCSEVANASHRAIEKHGFKKDTLCGHSEGLNGLEPSAYLVDGDMTVLKPNMAFHLLLCNFLEEDFSCFVSETFRVTESGVEVLTRAPRKLFEL
ncbi:aminopeptidase P family protein [Bradyrhizobium diazoefficiens]|uniref:M24 family metallopeptidase n=1 Tax=Bradyrhizobium diazoefficiens TaxID=1355477 RepID=UPI00190A3A3F|nr:Xaa-Pro peptidase family protein [Bradyrhizobium diazoefficiens]QQO35546.1 aminopeptidase P family protein [Bradyrhizobium diazoefficiens]